MSTTETTTTTELASDTDYELRNIGIEFEFPLARNAENVPATLGQNSNSLRTTLSNRQLEEEFGDRAGYVGSDHVGAEITSDVLNLHSGDPERWYNMVIELAESEGYTFAQCGYGSTVFGLHLHLSDLPERKADFLNELTQHEVWSRVFFCSSVTPSSADPWRGGGTRPHPGASGTCNQRHRNNHGAPNRHYEFRLPEPCAPEHFELIMEFLRRLETDGRAIAEEYAEELVFSRDERLTPIQQYTEYSNRYDDWPDEDALSYDGGRHDSGREESARFLHDLMEGNL